MLAAMTDRTSPSPSLNRAQRYLLAGDVGKGIDELNALEVHARADHFLLQQIAEAFVKCSQHEAAARCYERSVALQPANPEYLYNLAASKIALGQLDQAETLFTQVIRLRPDDHGAWLNRSALRKRTAENNHVAQLKYVKEHLAKDDPGNVPICYALAKELEDLAHYDESFEALQEGSVRRREMLQYDVRDDVEAMKLIAETFDKKALQSPRTPSPADRPIFILGLPRSGTTLVDRIISSHSKVGSLGEHNMLAIALMHEAGSDGNMGKTELIQKSAEINFPAMGERYRNSIAGFGNPAARLVDKTPLNFLYIGLIRRALPDARIIHLRRNPVDSCYAMYKTLFRAGYPFSYSLQDVGRYYIAYRELMDHWRQAIPDSFLDVDYEQLVTNQEGETRRMLHYLDLGWEDDCLNFHRHDGPSATASAAQVRQPIYSSSVGLWRKYARQLAPFANKLRAFGINVD